VNFTYGLPVYGAVDSNPTDIQNFLDRCFKRRYTSKRMDIRELLEKAYKKLFNGYVQWIPIAHVVTLFRRRKKQSMNLEPVYKEGG